jgi:hypothetical protein
MPPREQVLIQRDVPPAEEREVEVGGDACVAGGAESLANEPIRR